MSKALLKLRSGTLRYNWIRNIADYRSYLTVKFCGFPLQFVPKGASGVNPETTAERDFPYLHVPFPAPIFPAIPLAEKYGYHY